MRVWALLFLFLGLPLAEGTRKPSSEAELWLQSGIDSSFISRFIRNEYCHQSERWLEACRRGVERGTRFLLHSESADGLKADWEKEKTVERPDFENFLKRIESAETSVPKAMVWGYMANYVITTFDPHARIQPEGFYETVGTGAHNEMGIGAEFEILEEGVIARRVFKDSPAAQAGIRVGDRLLAVNGQAVQTGAGALEALRKLRGGSDSLVQLELGRDAVSVAKTLRLVRIVHPDAVLDLINLRDRRYARITIYAFTRGVCDLVQKHVQTATDRNAIGVVLDLRFNPGGLSSEGLCVGRIFAGNRELLSPNFFAASLLPGELDLRPRMLAAWPAEGAAFFPSVQNLEIPLTVLVNAGTASIAEIVAAGLQDIERAWLVGIGTMGKGTFQLSTAMSFNSKLKIRHSFAEAVRINAGVIQFYGVTPNFEASFEAGKSVHPWRLLHDKTMIPHPIPPSRESTWTEPRLQAQKTLVRCAGGSLTSRYSKLLRKKQGFEDHQQALAMAVLQCDADLKAAK